MGMVQYKYGHGHGDTHITQACLSTLWIVEFAGPLAQGEFLPRRLLVSNTGGVPVQLTDDRYKFQFLLVNFSGALLENKMGYSPLHAGFCGSLAQAYILTGTL